MSQRYQLTTRGSPGRCQCFCLTFWKIPSLAYVPQWKTTAAEVTNAAALCEAAEPVRPAAMPSGGAVLPGTAQTWRCCMLTWCTLATPLPVWLSRCPLLLQLGQAHPGAVSPSGQVPTDAHGCPWLLHATLPTGVPTCRPACEATSTTGQQQGLDALLWLAG